MKWTNEVPTKAGAYFWRPNDVTEELLAHLKEDGFGSRSSYGGASEYRHWGGEWCRLVPAEEIEKAWVESRQSVGCFGECDAITHGDQWYLSQAKRVMYGKEEPTST